MQTIHKYPIEITDIQEIQMPQGAEIIHAGLDPQGNPCVWARVEAENFAAPVRIVVAGTGLPLSREAGGHLMSFKDGAFIWHVFLAIPMEQHLSDRLRDYERANADLRDQLRTALDALHLMANQYIAIGDLPDGRPKYDHMHMCAGEDCLDVMEFHGRVKSDQSDY